MRILFVRSNRVGDAVLSTGLLGHLLRTYPAAAITVACGPTAEACSSGWRRHDDGAGGRASARLIR